MGADKPKPDRCHVVRTSVTAAAFLANSDSSPGFGVGVASVRACGGPPEFLVARYSRIEHWPTRRITMSWVTSSLRALSGEMRARWHGYFVGYGQQD